MGSNNKTVKRMVCECKWWLWSTEEVQVLRIKVERNYYYYYRRAFNLWTVIRQGCVTHVISRQKKSCVCGVCNCLSWVRPVRTEKNLGFPNNWAQLTLLNVRELSWSEAHINVIKWKEDPGVGLHNMEKRKFFTLMDPSVVQPGAGLRLHEWVHARGIIANRC
jgi:hypothetical protein